LEPQAAFGAKLRELRKQAGITQEQLGARCGMDLAAISRLERGVRDAQLSTIVRLARALEVTPSTLLERVR